LRIDLRVGDHNVDNSNFSSQSSVLSAAMPGSRPLPIDDDYDAIRRQLWLETDRIYKQALDTLAKKKAYLQNTVRSEVLPDFTPGDKNITIAPETPFSAPRTKWAKAIDDISKVFLKQEKIQKSRVSMGVRNTTSYYINSEGTSVVEPSLTTRLTLIASAQAADGMPLRNFLVYTSKHPDELPTPQTILGDARKMLEDLLALSTAPVAEEYSGPVLFVDEAAAELVAQGLAPNLAGRKMPLSDNPQVAAMSGRMENPYLSKVNTRVMAGFISVKAVPTTKALAGKPLLGAYTTDEEGTTAQDVTLVEKGLLKSLLTSRAPIKGFDKSNGHSRGGAAVPSVIQLTSEKKLPMSELKAALIEKVKEEGLPYGYMVRSIFPPSEATDLDEIDIRSLAMSQMQPNPSMFNLSKPAMCFKVYPDGREELVRGASFGGISINSFRDLTATSDTDFVYNFQTTAGGMPGISGLMGLLLGASGMSGVEYPATVITPALLLPGVDVKKPTGEYKKPPIVSYPGK
jgi:hypothetical protein